MRADLAALTPESITALSNAGLVKRAQKEIDQGKGPSLEEAGDGTITGTFPDGVVARLPPVTSLRDSPCTCGATIVCRHRVAVALAYPAWHAGRASAVPPPPRGAATSAWSPGEIPDDVLAEALGRRELEAASRNRGRGYVATVRRLAEGPPAAALATCTVRFLVPREVRYARCDCTLGGSCAHVALAVWAFREADARDRTAPELVVEIAGRSADPGDAVASALAPAFVLTSEVLLDGAVNAAASLAAHFARARRPLAEARLVWPDAVVESIEDALEAYRSRSARYHPELLAGAIAELHGRARAASAGTGAIPLAHVLGTEEAAESKLDHLRLVSLGARLSADGRERLAEVYLADPDTATVLVLSKRWTFAEKQTPLDGKALGSRPLAPGVTLAAAARGQIVTGAARRRPSRALELGSSRVARTTVVAQSGDWSGLPAPLLAPDAAALAATLAARPPRILRPRVLAEDVHAIPVAEVQAVEYAPGEQVLHARLADPAGHPFLLTLAHRAVAPGALDALAAALSGAQGRVRFVSGEARRVGGDLVLVPLAVVADEVIVPDLAPADARHAVAAGGRPEARTAHAAVLHEAERALAEAAHLGLRRVPPSWSERISGVATRLAAVGMGSTAPRLRALPALVAAARAAADPAAADALVRAWADASIRVAVALEAV